MKSHQELLSLTGQRTLITGVASGIGKAIALRFAEAGSDLILVDIHAGNLGKLKKQLAEFNTEVQTFTTDLEQKASIDLLWDQLGDTPVHNLVNNAGIYPFLPFMELTEAELQRIMDLNLNSVLWMCQHFIRHNWKVGGHIVNIGSIEAIMPFKKDLVQYSLSKVGVITLTRDLAREYAVRGFHINAILPGGIMTKRIKRTAVNTLLRFEFGVIQDGLNFKQRLPAGRLGQPDEVAKVVLMLCSDVASYMHGALIPVDGGFLSA